MAVFNIFNSSEGRRQDRPARRTRKDGESPECAALCRPDSPRRLSHLVRQLQEERGRGLLVRSTGTCPLYCQGRVRQVVYSILMPASGVHPLQCLISRRIAMLLLLTLLVVSSAARAVERIALVIGNSKYQNTAALPNPTADARKIAAALMKIGFGVVDLKFDLTFAEMRRELRDFNAVAHEAQMAVVFFAGHGMEFGGKTFLIPTDARLAMEQDLEWEIIPLDLVLTVVEPSQFQLVILDACRDNPLAAHMVIGRSAAPTSGGRSTGSGAKGGTRSVGPGLAEVQPQGNTLIAYAAKHGSYALDGDGENSPFTQALLDHIEEPGVEVRILFGMVRDNVVRRTHGRQEPFVYGSVGGRQLYLVPPRMETAVPRGGEQERKMWEMIQGKNVKELFDLYLQLYPQGSYTVEARQRLAALNPPPQRPAPIFKGEEITIAAAGPMTGPSSAFGAQIRAGSEMAVADINDTGGVLGHRLELVVADDKADPKEGVAVATRLAARKVVFVNGHFNSGISIPASDVYEREGIIMISPASSNPHLTQRGQHNIFRVSSRDDQQGVYAAQYLVRNYRDMRFAIVHDKTIYGKGMAADFRGALSRAGGKEVFYDSYDGKAKDYSALVTKLKQANPDILFVGGFSTDIGLIVRQMRAGGMKTLLVAGDTLADDEFWSVAGAAGEGTLFTKLPDARQFLEASAIVKRFRERGIEPDGYTLHAYASVQAWAEAAQRAGSTTASEVAQMLVKGRFTTALGTLGFDPQGDVTIPGFVMYRWSAGKYSQLN
jgi:branched-chain amino acid transport system substrate-binding protein